MRCTVHVDAGYLYSALATRSTGSSNRAAITVDEQALIGHLIELATSDSGLRILRVLWYDAARNGIPDHHQRQIGMVDNVKLRMGRVNAFGDQKGVDLRLGLDLVSLGHNRAAEVAYLLSGDDDLTEAVADAQDLGLQIKLLTIPSGTNPTYGVAANLSLAADGAVALDPAVLDDIVARTARPAPAAPSVQPGELEQTAALAPKAPVPSGNRPRIPVIPPVPAQPALTDTGASAPAPAAPAAAVPVYSSVTGSVGYLTDTDLLTPDLVAEVAESVYRVWAETADSDEVKRLQQARPNIPPTIDRILLTDLVTRSGRPEIPTWARYALREAFWMAAR